MATTTYDVFLSLRFCEAERAGQALKHALEQRGMRVFLCRQSPGDDMTEAITDALHKCKMAVILGTESYAKKTTVSFSTYQELRYIISRRKPFFLVKMCDDFAEIEAKFRLTEDIMHYPWQPNQNSTPIHVPTDLVDQVAAKLQRVELGKSNETTGKPVLMNKPHGPSARRDESGGTSRLADRVPERPEESGGHTDPPQSVRSNATPEHPSRPLRVIPAPRNLPNVTGGKAKPAIAQQQSPSSAREPEDIVQVDADGDDRSHTSERTSYASRSSENMAAPLVSRQRPRASKPSFFSLSRSVRPSTAEESKENGNVPVKTRRGCSSRVLLLGLLALGIVLVIAVAVPIATTNSGGGASSNASDASHGNASNTTAAGTCSASPDGVLGCDNLTAHSVVRNSQMSTALAKMSTFGGFVSNVDLSQMSTAVSQMSTAPSQMSTGPSQRSTTLQIRRIVHLHEGHICRE